MTALSHSRALSASSTLAVLKCSVLRKLLVVGFLVAALIGCGRGALESEVSGTVTLDGKRIGPGVVVFSPAEGGKPATGSIESNGSYTLKTSRELGLAAGKYAVAVSIREMPAEIKPGDRPPPGKLLIPENYEQSTTSGLEFDVQPGRNTIDIELNSTDSTDSGGPAP